MVGNLGKKEKVIEILKSMEKSKGFKVLICPKCGANAYCGQSVTVGGLIVQRADKEGNIHQSEGAHENCIKWKCEKCGYVFGD